MGWRRQKYPTSAGNRKTEINTLKREPSLREVHACSRGRTADDGYVTGDVENAERRGPHTKVARRRIQKKQTFR
jgi:hypothetical protein